MTEAVRKVSLSTARIGVAAAVVYAVTGDWRLAIGAGVLDATLQTIVSAVHARAWSLALRRPARKF